MNKHKNGCGEVREHNEHEKQQCDVENELPVREHVEGVDNVESRHIENVDDENDENLCGERRENVQGFGKHFRDEFRGSNDEQVSGVFVNFFVFVKKFVKK